jgi:hypothetical protein
MWVDVLCLRTGFPPGRSRPTILENGNPLADNREKFSPETVHARIIKTHLEHAIKGPNNIGYNRFTNTI